MSLSVANMNVGDVYRDAHGREFRVVGYWTQPVVIMVPADAPENHDRSKQMIGGVSGLMWAGFKLVRTADGEPVQ